MEIKPTKSSTVAGMGYDPQTRKMVIKFAAGGTYEYENVDPDFYTAFERSESKGKFVHTHIRNKIKGVKVPPTMTDVAKTVAEGHHS